ncbi:MAG: hypothetical protein EOP84_17130 [Verrucomicrobiaceae bacterium]|nr:MAG: hypothetical protein EOP84_17130 [Verrucomicrobiaceae bacterium]
MKRLKAHGQAVEFDCFLRHLLFPGPADLGGMLFPKQLRGARGIRFCESRSGKILLEKGRPGVSGGLQPPGECVDGVY